MDIPAEKLTDGVILRLATEADAPALAAAYTENREHLAPWEPRRPEKFFTTAGQAAVLGEKLRQFAEQRTVPWVLESAGGRIAGTITLSGIVLGPWRSAYLGYWIAADHQGRGLATSAVRAVCRVARETVGLHRVEATTLLDNAGSQRVLAKCGFEHIGTAPRYLAINGAWRDHRIFQRILHDDEPTP
ncbi:GNAT family N-acetyltransferase [Streptomyces sp. NPDC001480]|uniref:GNAT family N-acetyltransferase n=1 Tax=Streptomyces sp. NPDC001480 TaxID=3364577 RepID=UPI003695DC40